jgi:DNA invertase Pin-like site-specific DNA recombinase
VKAYAELYDLELAETIVDAGESSKSLDPPGLQRALAMLKTGKAEALLVAKLDRLTRSRGGPADAGRSLLRPWEGRPPLRRRADRHPAVPPAGWS